MQRGRLAGTGRTADKEQAVGLFDALDQVLMVTRRQAKLIQLDRLPRRQNAHHHILDTTSSGNGRHPEFDVQRSVFF